MDVTKPYKVIGFGAMDVTKLYKFMGFGAGLPSGTQSEATTWRAVPHRLVFASTR